MDEVHESLLSMLIEHTPSKEKNSKLNFKDLGLIWEEIVQQFLKKNKKEFLHKLGLDNYFLYDFKFSYTAKYADNLLLENENRSHGVFDCAIFDRNKPETPLYIIEVKLGPQNISLKELKYLHYFPNAKVIFIFFFPKNINYPNKIYESLKERLLDSFYSKYDSYKKFSFKRKRLQFMGLNDIGMKDVSVNQMKEYLDRRVQNIAKTLVLMYQASPNYLLIKDYSRIIGIYHNYVRRILRLFNHYTILEIFVGDTLDSMGRTLENLKMYRLSNKFVKHKKTTNLIQTLSKKYNIYFSEDSIPDRSGNKIILRDNDKIVLSYLSSFSTWISTQDISENSGFKSTSEINRCLDRLHNLGKIEHKRGYLLDPTSVSNKTYETSFYKSKSFIKKDYVPPKRFFSPLDLTLQELRVIGFLMHHDFTSKNKLITVKDIAGNHSFNQSTVNVMIKKLAKRDLKEVNENHPPALKLETRWVEGITGKITKMRESPVVYLSITDSLKEDINRILEKIGYEFPECKLTMRMLDFPLARNERLVIDAIRNGHNTIDTIAERIKINEIKKSNRAMIKVIVDRLTDQNTWRRRLGENKTLINIQGDKLQINWIVKLDSDKKFDNS